MPELDIKDKNNTVVGKIALSDDLFGVSAKQGVLHEAVVNFLANQRQGTHATKTKGLDQRRRQKTVETKEYRKGAFGKHTFPSLERRRNDIRSAAEGLFLQTSQKGEEACLNECLSRKAFERRSSHP